MFLFNFRFKSVACFLIVQNESKCFATGKASESMHHADENVARLFIFLFEITLHQPINRLFFAVEMRTRPAARLVDRDTVIVLIKDFEKFVEGHGSYSGFAKGHAASSTSS